MKLESPSILAKKFFFARPLGGGELAPLGPPCVRQCCSHSMRRVYVTDRYPSICCLSVPTYRPLHFVAAGLLLWARNAGDIDR